MQKKNLCNTDLTIQQLYWWCAPPAPECSQWVKLPQLPPLPLHWIVFSTMQITNHKCKHNYSVHFYIDFFCICVFVLAFEFELLLRPSTSLASCDCQFPTMVKASHGFWYLYLLYRQNTNYNIFIFFIEKNTNYKIFFFLLINTGTDFQITNFLPG